MEKIDQFDNLKLKVVTLLNDLELQCSENENTANLRQGIKEAVAEIKSDKFLVAVVGVIKRGKSTLLNALLKADVDILSTQVNPETAKLAFLNYDDNPHAIIYTKDKKEIDIEISELPKYTSTFDGVSPKGEKAKVENTLYAEIFYPNDILKKGFCIIDTPGVDDPDEARSNVTLNFIDRADAVIFLMSANEGGLKNSELQFIQSKILNNLGTSKGIIYVFNKISYLKERQLKNELPKLIEKNEKLLNETFGEKINIFPIDALDALRGIRDNDVELYEKSRFGPFKKELENYLVQEKGKIFLRLRINKFIIESLEPFIGELLEKIAYEPTSLTMVENELKKSQTELEKLSNKTNNIISNYENAKNTLKNWIQKEITSDFNTHISISTKAIPNLSRDINSVTEFLTEKINTKTKKFIKDMISDFELENIKISQPSFDIQVKSIDTSKYFLRKQEVISGNSDGGFVGAAIGGFIGFFVGGPIGAAAGAAAGRRVGKEFNSEDKTIEHVTFDELGLKKEIDGVRNMLIKTFHSSLETYFSDVSSTVSKSLANKRKNINNIFETNKKILFSEKSTFKEYKNEINSKINQLNQSKSNLSQLLKEVETL